MLLDMEVNICIRPPNFIHSFVKGKKEEKKNDIAACSRPFIYSNIASKSEENSPVGRN